MSGRGRHIPSSRSGQGSFPVGDPALDVAKADALDPEAVERVVAGHDAVISTLGVHYGSEAATTYSASIENISEAMTAHGIRRGQQYVRACCP
ncbi:NAD(P)H-binding protein [Actinocorallia populi]|uniref:NAD(P)H-binding protein n=1 Tax=Actinocorallia populi TaxID=2079200 RepID=UPI0018E51092|nr:NAD(P)H-binding protein [Actinocorallia populi]